MLNHICIAGRITHDLELRKTQSDVSNIQFSIACDDDYKPKDGSDRDVDFVHIKAWRGTADFINSYFGKGRTIIVSGRLKADKYTDKDGNQRTDTYVLADSVYFGDSKRENDQNSSAQSGTGATIRPLDDILNDAGGNLPF